MITRSSFIQRTFLRCCLGVSALSAASLASSLASAQVLEQPKVTAAEDFYYSEFNTGKLMYQWSDSVPASVVRENVGQFQVNGKYITYIQKTTSAVFRYDTINKTEVKVTSVFPAQHAGAERVTGVVWFVSNGSLYYWSGGNPVRDSTINGARKVVVANHGFGDEVWAIDGSARLLLKNFGAPGWRNLAYGVSNIFDTFDASAYSIGYTLTGQSTWYQMIVTNEGPRSVDHGDFCGGRGAMQAALPSIWQWDLPHVQCGNYRYYWPAIR